MLRVRKWGDDIGGFVSHLLDPDVCYKFAIT